MSSSEEKRRLARLREEISGLGIREAEVSVFRRSIRLSGGCDDWKSIVRAGKKAAKLGYKGVVNEIELDGFTPPPIRRSKIEDGAIDGERPDVLVIGGGVIGCAIARELRKWDISVLLCEKESDVAMHASSRNDGMIHPGIASHIGSLRGKMNVEGNLMYTQLCKDLKIPFKRYGNFILYSDHLFGVGGRAVLGARARAFGIPGGHVDRRRMHEMEPNITDEALGAFSYPMSGVLSPYKLTVALAENAVENGAQVSLDTIVTSMEMEHGRIAAVHTNRGTVYPRLVVNAAGVFSDVIAKMADDQFFTIHPRKGELVILDKKKGRLVQRSMGLVSVKAATSDTKGGGVMRTIDGNVLVGPDAYEQPLREDFSTHADHIDAILEKHLPLIKGFAKSDVITYFAGVRASNYEEEFIVERSEQVDNLVHAAAIQSPGLASAPAIAKRIAEISTAALGEQMDVHKNDRFDPVRKAAPVLKYMSLEEKQKLIEKNPDYGVIICRCEEISKGEIIDCIHSPIPVTSLDGIKRRVRPGMGRCQGGFCSPLVTNIIAQETGLRPEQITKNGDGTEFLYGPTNKGTGKTSAETKAPAKKAPARKAPAKAAAGKAAAGTQKKSAKKAPAKKGAAKKKGGAEA